MEILWGNMGIHKSHTSLVETDVPCESALSANRQSVRHKMAANDKISSTGEVYNEEKVVPDTTSSGLNSEDQAFLDAFTPQQEAKVWRKVCVLSSSSEGTS